MANMKYFADVGGETVQLAWISTMRNREFEELFPGIKGRRSDSFSRYVGYLDETSKRPVPEFRSIEFKRNPSLHKCDARCQHAKGHSCECSCGGKNHGKGA
jgi:hypothetical protein